MVDGDAGAGGFTGEQARGGSEQIPGIDQDDAAIHVAPLSPSRFLESARPRHRYQRELDHRRGESDVNRSYRGLHVS